MNKLLVIITLVTLAISALFIPSCVCASPDLEFKLSEKEVGKTITDGIRDYCTDMFPESQEKIRTCQALQYVSLDTFMSKYGKTIESLTNALSDINKKKKNVILSQDEKIVGACYFKYRMPKYGIANYFKVLMCVDLVKEKIKQKTY